MQPIFCATTTENAPGCMATGMWWRWPCRAPEVGSQGMVFDFTDLKRHLKELAERFDHVNLNELPPFTEIESTAENQARSFFDEMKKRLSHRSWPVGFFMPGYQRARGNGPSMGFEDGFSG